MSNVTGGQNWKSQSRQVLQNQYTASLSVFVPPWCWLQQCHPTCRTALDGFLCSYLDDDVSNAISPTSQNCIWWLSLFLPWCWCKQHCLVHIIELHLVSFFVLTLMLMQAMLSHPQNYTWWLSLFLPWCWCKQCCLTHRITLDGFLCSYLDVDASNAASSTELYLVAVLSLMLMQTMLPCPQNCTQWLSLFLPWCRCWQCCLTCRTTLDDIICSYLDVDASNIASPVELHLVPFFVQIVVVLWSVIPCIPVKHKLAIVQATYSFSLLDDSQVAFLKSTRKYHKRHTIHPGDMGTWKSLQE